MNHGRIVFSQIMDYFPQHSGQSQRIAQLENLSRHRSDFDRPGPHALCQSTSGHESQTSGLHAGFHRRRSVPVAVSFGSASPTQKRRQDAYPTRSRRRCGSPSAYIGCHPEKTTRPVGRHVRNSTNFGCYAFRENTSKKPVFCGFQQVFKEPFT